MAKSKVTVPGAKPATRFTRKPAIRLPKLEVDTPGKRVTAKAHSPKAMARAFRKFV